MKCSEPYRKGSFYYWTEDVFMPTVEAPSDGLGGSRLEAKEKFKNNLERYRKELKEALSVVEATLADYENWKED